MMLKDRIVYVRWFYKEVVEKFKQIGKGYSMFFKIYNNYNMEQFIREKKRLYLAN